MTKILVGYDGSESADAVLLDLRRAGLPRETEALIVTVADVIVAPGSSNYELVPQTLTSRRVTSALMQAARQTAQVLREAKELALRAADQVRALFPYWSVQAETLTGTVAVELIDKANEWKPDLIAVGSHGHSAIQRFIIGSVSKKLVTNSTHSIRVTRGLIETDVSKPPRLMIGLDGTPEAEQAVRAVGRRVWPYGTEARIVTVDDGTLLPTEQMILWARTGLSAIGLKLSVAMLKGDPRRVLVDQAQEWNADSIFVGGRRFGSALERLQIGSVATALVTKAPCSVEVARTPVY